MPPTSSFDTTTEVPPLKWTEGAVLDVLREMYLPYNDPLKTEEWAFLTQVPLRSVKTLYRDQSVEVVPVWATNERTIDALIVRNWAGGAKGHERIAFEVKVSRADFRNENDEKRAPAEASAHRCAYVAPAGLLTPEDLPEGWGLVEVFAEPLPRVGEVGATAWRLRAKWRVRAKKRTPTTNLDYLVSAGFRRASRAEERIRRGENAAAELVALRAEVESLRGALVRAQDARDREIERAKSARTELLSMTGTECLDCNQPLTWKRGGRHDSRWLHRDQDREEACSTLRRARYEAQRASDPYASFDRYPTPRGVGGVARGHG